MSKKPAKQGEVTEEEIKEAWRAHQQLDEMEHKVPVYAETPDELEARIAKLESRLDWLYRWTLSDRNGHKYYSPAFTERAKDDRFPLPDYDAPGGPRKPQGEP